MNPRAATNDLLPFQGSPFGQLGYFFRTNGFQDRLVMTTSIPLHNTPFIQRFLIYAAHIANYYITPCDVDYSITYLKCMSRLSFQKYVRNIEILWCCDLDILVRAIKEPDRSP